MSSSEKMAANFVKKYTAEKLNHLLSQFYERTSNEKIAHEFGVTRQRVHQWYCAFVDVEIRPKECVLLYTQMK